MFMKAIHAIKADSGMIQPGEYFHINEKEAARLLELDAATEVTKKVAVEFDINEPVNEVNDHDE